MSGADGSTIWRGSVGVLLYLAVAGAWAVVVGLLCHILTGRLGWPGAVLGAAVGGVMGAEAGVWALDRLLGRYPGRSIACIGMAITAAAALLLILGGPPAGVTLDGTIVYWQVRVAVAVIAQAFVLHALLIRPDRNLMKPVRVGRPNERNLGSRDPAAFSDLADYPARLARMQARFDPASAEFRALAEAQGKLREAAELIIGRSTPYGAAATAMEQVD